MKNKYNKIEIAPRVQVESFEDLADDFFLKVFGIKDVLITDESSVYDFDFELIDLKVKHKTQDILKKIQDIYDVDVFDIKDLNLVEILRRIRILKNI